MIVEILFRLIMLHLPGGGVTWVNPDTITYLRESEGKGHYTREARCLVNLDDGRFVAVIEDCEAVRRLSENSNQQRPQP